MSTHANQSVKGGPSSSRKSIVGANPTYKSSVQKDSRATSSTKASGKGQDREVVMGSGSAPKSMPMDSATSSFGTGHYSPSK